MDLLSQDPLLRGMLRVESKELVWSGKWAFGRSGHSKKQTNKFLLRAPFDVEDENVSLDGKVIRSASFVFNGFFVVSKPSRRNEEVDLGSFVKVKVREENVKIDFVKQNKINGYDIKGNGKNKYGDFTIIGSYSSESGQIWGQKEYNEDDAEYSDDEDAADEDDDNDFDDPDDLTAELNFLREDAAAHGESTCLGGNSDSLLQDQTKRRKRVKRKAVVDSTYIDGQSKEPKVVVKNEGDCTGAAAVHSTAAVWTFEDLKASQQRLKIMVNIGEVGGIKMVLDELANGGRVTVPLLQGVDVGRDVKNLKKHPDPDVAAKAANIVDSWKKMVM